MNNRVRRVGTLSAGIVLVGFGIVFLLRMAVPWLDYGVILSFWPVVLILLGAEMLYAYTFGKSDTVKYDGGAIAVIILLCIFAMCMAGGELIFNTLSEAAKYHYHINW